MDMLSKLITPGILFLLTLASGVWLSSAGKPLNNIIFTIHKLIALAVVVLTIIQMYKLFAITEIQLLFMALIIFTGLCVLALFATGALMSLANPAYNIWLTIHKVAPALAFISMSVMVYLLAGGKI